jgi:hypothetical protein
MIKVNRIFKARFFQPVIIVGALTAREANRMISSKAVQFEIELPFSVEFDVQRNTLASANTCELKFYNLPERVRSAIYKDKTDFELYKGAEFFVGYGTTLSRVFRGNIIEAYSYREKVDWITIVHCQDGGFSMVNSNSSFSAPAGTSMGDLIKKTMGDLKGVSSGNVGAFNGESTRGTVVIGNTADLLCGFTKNSFFVDNETAYAVNENEVIQGELPLVSIESGLIGTPIKEQSFVRVEMIMEPRIKTGQAIQLISKSQPYLNGVYKVLGFTHQGSVSPVKCGEAKTKLTLSYGTKPLRLIVKDGVTVAI